MILPKQDLFISTIKLAFFGNCIKTTMVQYILKQKYYEQLNRKDPSNQLLCIQMT